MRYHTLSEWLNWQETLHFTDIDPGLERIGQVWKRMGGMTRLPFKVVTIAGTNGKGSSVAILESIVRQAGYKTGTYTSPHILRYNERICVGGTPVSDEMICQAFHQIDVLRGDISLTYFEFATLAAVSIFCQQNIDIAILEVGMGGRLDAVNIFDADIALITPVSLDHTHWLGNTREQIGWEKAGIISAGNPVVCSDKQPPESVLTYAAQMAAKVYQAGVHFDWEEEGSCWSWSSPEITLSHLPLPALEGKYQLQNAAAVIQIIMLLNEQGLKVARPHIAAGLTSVILAGRFQRIKGEVETILDVTHNQQGANNLCELLRAYPISGNTYAVVGMLNDKDMATVASIMKNQFEYWFVGTIRGERGQTAEELVKYIARSVDNDKIVQADSIEAAYHQAAQKASKGDRIVVFGSFHTVEAVIRLHEAKA